MKLGSLRKGKDGQLVVVSKDLKKAVLAPEIAPTLQQAIDNWSNVEKKLKALYSNLNEGSIEDAFELDLRELHSPLPRAYQWVDGSGYLNHVELVRKARNAEMPESFWTDPIMYQGASDKFMGPTDPIQASSEDWGVDFEAELVAITDDVPMGTSQDEAESHVKLLMLVNDVSLRNLIPDELAKGFGFLQSKPSSSFSPVCVTPDELGDDWKDGKVNLPLEVHFNGKAFGNPHAGGKHMVFNFAKFISHAAKTRHLCAGTIVGAGTVSNQGDDGGPGKPIAEGGVGYSCIAELRVVEKLLHGTIQTPFMKFGDSVRIEMFDSSGISIFGAIDQKLEKYTKPTA